ncbi:hypothetical protein ACEQ8H_000154 [Pleosporales sp. CAS-2024a]
MMQQPVPHHHQHPLPPQTPLPPQHMAQHQQMQQQHPHQQPYGPVPPAPPQLAYQHGDKQGDYAGIRGGRSYRLRVEQQPIRARMCGFGDKDRRPITPPPCIRLVVYDTKTNQEIDPSDVDSTFFVLMVDLWHEDSSRAVNLVRHSSAAPTVSISSSTVTSYPPPPERTMYMATNMLPQWDPVTGRQPPPQPAHYPQPSIPPQYSYQPNPGNNTAYAQYGAQNGFAPNPAPMPMALPTSSLSQNHTRNLIGMNAVNACRLNDPDGKLGFWFVLQDLSVRTEGNFRLKLSMCDVGTGQGTNSVVSTGKCPVLATSFSEPFTVYSAKKFPGVIESTPLSKCFAQQGIKIPIRLQPLPKTIWNTLPNSPTQTAEAIEAETSTTTLTFARRDSVMDEDIAYPAPWQHDRDHIFTCTCGLRDPSNDPCLPMSPTSTISEFVKTAHL